MTGVRDPEGADDCSDPSRRRLLAATGVLCGSLLAGCLGDDGGSDDGSDGAQGDDPNGDSTSPTDGMDDGGTDDGGTGDNTTTDGEMGGGDEDGGDGDTADSALPEWQTTQLTNVRDDESFTIADLDGPVVIQSFAVWCPKCQRQSEAVAEVSDSVTVVGLNTDPNEDAEKVRNHAESNGFDWRFAVAPTEMTKSLVDEFGSTVTNAPSTPVIVVCESGESTFKSGQINDASAIMAAADEC